MEKIMRKLLPFTIAFALVAASAFAQQETPGAHFIEQWDINGDGQVTLAEAEEKRGDVFVMFDAAEDGVMDAADWTAVEEHLAAEMDGKGDAKGMGRGPGKLIHASMTAAFNDADADGKVTQAEFVAAPKSLFAQIDRNGDGVMTTEDFGKK
jgi:hypothetical protein